MVAYRPPTLVETEERARFSCHHRLLPSRVALKNFYDELNATDEPKDRTTAHAATAEELFHDLKRMPQPLNGRSSSFSCRPIISVAKISATRSYLGHLSGDDFTAEEAGENL